LNKEILGGFTVPYTVYALAYSCLNQSRRVFGKELQIQSNMTVVGNDFQTPLEHESDLKDEGLTNIFLNLSETCARHEPKPRDVCKQLEESYSLLPSVQE